MPYLRDRTDRAKAMAMVAGLHIALGAALLTGLAGGPVREAAKALRGQMVEPLTLEPELTPPPPEHRAPAERDAAAPPDLLARPTPIVAPRPLIPLRAPSPVNTSDERAPVEGADRSAGAAAIAGPGSGAGGTGSGTGGGGTGGEGSGTGGGVAVDARLLSGRISDSDYRRIRQMGSVQGQAALGITVGATGMLVDCQTVRSSGNSAVDVELCQLLQRTRWAPALGTNGRPTSQQKIYHASWTRN